jgi:hypothetical protein
MLVQRCGHGVGTVWAQGRHRAGTTRRQNPPRRQLFRPKYKLLALTGQLIGQQTGIKQQPKAGGLGAVWDDNFDHARLGQGKAGASQAQDMGGQTF